MFGPSRQDSTLSTRLLEHSRAHAALLRLDQLITGAVARPAPVRLMQDLEAEEIAASCRTASAEGDPDALEVASRAACPTAHLAPNELA